MDEKLWIGFIGAGAVNFGGGEGPWDHASRLEKIEGIEMLPIAGELHEPWDAEKRAGGKADQRLEG